jgi:hypothetical protein
MCYAPDRLAAFARLRPGPLAWYVFLRLADDPAADPAALAAEVGMAGSAARRCVRHLLAAGALVATARGLEPAPPFAPANRVVHAVPPGPSPPPRPTPPPRISTNSTTNSTNSTDLHRSPPGPPPILANGPDDVLRPAGTAPADPEREARWDWLCGLVDRIWPTMDLGLGLAHYRAFGYDPILMYLAVRQVAAWTHTPRSPRAFLAIVDRLATQPPAVAPTELPAALGGTLDDAAARIEPGRPAASADPAAGRIDRRRAELRRLIDQVREPEPEPAPRPEVYRVRAG